jgi:hypothetical protein
MRQCHGYLPAYTAEAVTCPNLRLLWLRAQQKLTPVLMYQGMCVCVHSRRWYYPGASMCFGRQQKLTHVPVCVCLCSCDQSWYWRGAQHSASSCTMLLMALAQQAMLAKCNIYVTLHTLQLLTACSGRWCGRGEESAGLDGTCLRWLLMAAAQQCQACFKVVHHMSFAACPWGPPAYTVTHTCYKNSVNHFLLTCSSGISQLVHGIRSTRVYRLFYGPSHTHTHTHTHGMHSTVSTSVDHA